MRGNKIHKRRFAATDHKENYLEEILSRYNKKINVFNIESIPIEGFMVEYGIEAAVFKRTPP